MKKAETWETSDKNIRCLFDSKTAFTETKTRGAGREAILKFLGGNWKQWMIQNQGSAIWPGPFLSGYSSTAGLQRVRCRPCHGARSQGENGQGARRGLGT